MFKTKKINILLCFDDNDWNYTRHAAVTILSLLETNKSNKIKIYILTSYLPQENISELKRIVCLYNQEIEFIIHDGIVPDSIKKVIINKNSTLGFWARYRYFFPKYIKNIDRILYIDCDVLVRKDISEIYNMDMNWKAIVGYYDCSTFLFKNRIYWTNNYINSWVLLFNTKKYDMSKINVKKMKEINEKYSIYFNWNDQDKINVIFKDDIFVWNCTMNYLITNKYFTKWLNEAKIVHCLEKPYIQYSNIPQKLINIYNSYLNKTKWKWFPIKKDTHWYIYHIQNNIRHLYLGILYVISFYFSKN